MKNLIAIGVLFLFIGCSPKRPENFKPIKEVLPDVEIEARYFSTHNFMGRKVTGYHSEKLLLTTEALTALEKVQAELKTQNLGLKIFDAYRPQRAVNDFVRWCADENDTLNKRIYYPDLAKKELIPGDYIAEKSGHSRGSTVDLTLIHLSDLSEIDMGTPWDYFGKESHGNYSGITILQQENRQLLKTVMNKYGFKSLPEEWWHFTLIDEPYPDTYFDFEVE